jgi:acyl-CoA synthetase (NDP forming)
MDSSFLALFSRSGIVVIGTPSSPKKLGYGVARNLIQSGYQGAVDLVSQKQRKLLENLLIHI